MAKRLWEEITGGTDLKLWVDPEPVNKVADVAEQARLQSIRDGNTDIRTELAECGGYPDLASFDDFIQTEIDNLKDRVDSYDYDTRVHNLTVMDGAWFTPDSVQSVESEDVGNEADKAIDGNTVTFFRDSVNHQHVIVFKLRDYSKKISKIRFWYATGLSARERLNNMDVHAANAIPNIDDPSNILETGINITWPGVGGVWVEHVLAVKKNRMRYIKLVVDDTDNGNNHIQIREFQVWVEPKDPE